MRRKFKVFADGHTLDLRKEKKPKQKKKSIREHLAELADFYGPDFAATNCKLSRGKR